MQLFTGLQFFWGGGGGRPCQTLTSLEALKFRWRCFPTQETSQCEELVFAKIVILHVFLEG